MTNEEILLEVTKQNFQVQFEISKFILSVIIIILVYLLGRHDRNKK